LTIKDAALVNFKDLKLPDGVEADNFLAYCWLRASVGFLNREIRDET